jgi:hypothetical protein
VRRPEPAAAASYTLSCERLLPESLRSRWAPGSTVRATHSQAGTMNCEIEVPGEMPVSASYTCRGGPFDARYFSEFKRKLPRTGAPEDVRVGTGGVYWRASAAHTVSFADRDTGCLVSITTFAGDKRSAVELAGDVARALTPESAR